MNNRIPKRERTCACGKKHQVSIYDSSGSYPCRECAIRDANRAVNEARDAAVAASRENHTYNTGRFEDVREDLAMLTMQRAFYDEIVHQLCAVGRDELATLKKKRAFWDGVLARIK